MDDKCTVDITNSKSFLVHYVSYEWMFSAWENNDGSISAYEYIEGNWPDTVVIVYKDIRCFAKDVDWSEELIDSIRNEDLRELVNKLKIGG